MGTRIYVGNLPFTTDDEGLKALFAHYGTVVEGRIVTDRETGRARGFGFIELEKAEDAQKAISELHGSDFGGRTLTVNEARERENRPGTGGGGFSGGRPSGNGGGGGKPRRDDRGESRSRQAR